MISGATKNAPKPSSEMRPTNHSTPTLVLLSVLWLLGGWLVGVQTIVQAESVARPTESTSLATDSLLLDQYTGAYAAYSLIKLRSDYTGPAIRVRRSSDDAEQDFGFAEDDKLDVTVVESWLSGSDGYVTTWYSQVQGEPNLVQSDTSRQPRIAEGGTVFTDTDGRVAIKFDRSRDTYLTTATPLSSPFPIHDCLVYVVADKITDEGRQGIIALTEPGGADHYSFQLYGDGAGFLETDGVSGALWPKFDTPGFWAINYDNSAGQETPYSNHSQLPGQEITSTRNNENITLGITTETMDRGYDGFITEVGLFPSLPTDGSVQTFYDNVNSSWDLGPTDYNPDALMPQKHDWQVTLYDWLETINVADVTLPDETIEWDGTLSDTEKMAELWMQTEGASATRVVNSEPEWYVLDAGNGKGIEATGKVRIWHTPGGGGLERSWSNEPAFLYQLSVPKQDGSEGNGYKGDPALGKRALVVGAVDMIMYIDGFGAANWTDMHGKALLGWAETYRWCKDLLPPNVKTAYEKGMERSLDLIIERGARAVNTNMDMFSMHAAAEIYASVDSEVIKDKALAAVKRVLLGDVDATQVGGPNHTVYEAGSYTGGVFAPAGYIMEGDQPEVYYNGESYYHLLGAYNALMDPSTGSVPSEWSFLETVLQRMSEWKAYQMFYDDGRGGGNTKNVYAGGAGFSGRTSAGEPTNQASTRWRDVFAASVFDDARYLWWDPERGSIQLDGRKILDVSRMESDITDRLSDLDTDLSNTNTGQPPEWGGWSPWTKKTPYMPPDGWYSEMKSLMDSKDHSTYSPFERPSSTHNKALGGPPTGKEFWSYRDSDGNGNSWGFFVEADAHQGHYAGWYGGKIETFWTEATGILLMNRHGKSGGGCGSAGDSQDPGDGGSTCPSDLERYPGHHVWGRGENNNVFTTLWLRGRDLTRTSTFDTEGSPPTVTVNNVFNDPSQPAGEAWLSGEQTGSEIEGSFEVENRFEAQNDGLKVTHTLTSDETDQVNELWATLPVFLRFHRLGLWGPQTDMENTTIEYWSAGAWQSMPEDTSGDGVPEMVSTTALRLGRDQELGAGVQYAYVAFSSSESIRLSKDQYSDPYQTRTLFRSVHIDLHGNPGTAQTLPASKSVSYTVQTTDPTSEGGDSTIQEIHLQKGWNIASTFVSPTEPDMDSVLSGLRSEIVVVENDVGERYHPAENVNEIGQWNSENAYSIYANSDVTLSIEGDTLGSPTITLEEGWNLVPYFLSSPLSIEEVLSSISEDLVIVKDEIGRIHWPEESIESLELMEPGKGYKIYVRQSTTLTYP